MNPKLSVIIPSIRPGNLKRLYESVESSFSGEFEFIVISPYPLPKFLKEKNNVKFIEDFGNPVRAQQIGIINATGDYILWGGADDGYFLGKSVDTAVNSLIGKDYKTLVIGKYYEGSDNPFMNSIRYYYINTHNGSRSRFIDNDCLMFMVGVIPRRLLLEIGGLDSQFEVLPMAFNDISVRLKNYRCNFIFQEEIMFRCSHMPGHLGDHGPINDAQTINDEPLFRFIYSSRDSMKRDVIDINNWKNVPERWERRFGKDENISNK